MVSGPEVRRSQLKNSLSSATRSRGAREGTEHLLGVGEAASATSDSLGSREGREATGEPRRDDSESADNKGKGA